jgi:hypothetical protein
MAVDRRTPEFVARLAGMEAGQLDRLVAANEDLVEIALAFADSLEADRAPEVAEMLALETRLEDCAAAYREVVLEVGKVPSVWRP